MTPEGSRPSRIIDIARQARDAITGPQTSFSSRDIRIAQEVARAHHQTIVDQQAEVAHVGGVTTELDTQIVRTSASIQEMDNAAGNPRLSRTGVSRREATGLIGVGLPSVALGATVGALTRERPIDPNPSLLETIGGLRRELVVEREKRQAAEADARTARAAELGARIDLAGERAARQEERNGFLRTIEGLKADLQSEKNAREEAERKLIGASEEADRQRRRANELQAREDARLAKLKKREEFERDNELPTRFVQQSRTAWRIRAASIDEIANLEDAGAADVLPFSNRKEFVLPDPKSWLAPLARGWLNSDRLDQHTEIYLMVRDDSSDSLSPVIEVVETREGNTATGAKKDYKPYVFSKNSPRKVLIFERNDGSGILQYVEIFNADPTNEIADFQGKFLKKKS